jgi:hypothetical protein
MFEPDLFRLPYDEIVLDEPMRYIAKNVGPG